MLAAVVEMIHTATLVHDDVLDEASLRRHRETINARCDNEASVLVGDFLFTHAFYLASSLETTFACQTIGRATNIVCEGELRQIHSRGNFALTEAEYLAIIEAKTAELCACCCRLGAHYAGATPHVEDALDRFGRNLGIAFQIADDLLDLVGDEDSMGKSLGTDLEKQKPTLPLIRLLADSTHRRAADDNCSCSWRQPVCSEIADRFEVSQYHGLCPRQEAVIAESTTPSWLAWRARAATHDVLAALTELVVESRQE